MSENNYGALMMRGKLPAPSNLNNFGPTPEYVGIWDASITNSTMANGFPENAAQGILEVFIGGPFSCMQRFTLAGGKVYIRQLSAAWNGVDGPWSSWQPSGIFSGIIGDSRNAFLSIPAPSTTAAFTAESLIVEDSTGRQYRLKNVNVNINLTSSGVGGMTGGAVPATGFVALYVIYNPTTGDAALIAIDATTTSAPEFFPGTLPANFIASALVSVWRVISGQFSIGFQVGRSISTTNNSLLTTTTQAATATALNVSSIIPKNATALIAASGVVQSTPSSAAGIIIQSSPSGIGEIGTQAAATQGTTASNANATIKLITRQTIYYKTIGSGAGTFNIYSSGYEF
ncbi:hypothetical protein FR762_17895 [Enterobacter sp. E76]|nr:hypothetical protein FR762_17895 [Enterobacter sp. E76]